MAVLPVGRTAPLAWALMAVVIAGAQGCANRRADRGPGAADSGGAMDGGSAWADGSTPDGGLESDAGSSGDGATPDAGEGEGDAGTADAGPADVGPVDSGRVDAGPSDSGTPDAGPLDAGPPDSGPPDSGPADAGSPTGGCLSGATGTHVLRFRWEGTTSGSTAYVRYEANTLPDTTRWRVTAASSSIGYTPVFRDPYLGEGGLELSGTVFIDVELSTALLSSISNATLAVYGRSYSTTASGSFSWQTFSGTGATSSGFVSNSAPYEWYPADATAALPAGDDGTLLRIRAGPPSNALIVNRVEICFDAL